MQALERLVITGVLVGFKEHYKAFSVGNRGDSDVPGSGARGQCPVASYLAKYVESKSKQSQALGGRRRTAGGQQGICKDLDVKDGMDFSGLKQIQYVLRSPKEGGIKQGSGNMGLRTAFLKNGHREKRLRFSGVLDGEEVALSSRGFRKEQNKTKQNLRAALEGRYASVEGRQ